MNILFLLVMLISCRVYAENYTIVNLGGNKYVTGDKGYQGTGIEMGESYYFQDNRGNQITKLNDNLMSISTDRHADDLLLLDAYDKTKDEPHPLIETADTDGE